MKKSENNYAPDEFRPRRRNKPLGLRHRKSLGPKAKKIKR
jgi:hypothetical protein